MYGVENMLSSFPFRGLLVISGLFGVVFFGGGAVWIAARSFGRGRRLHLERTPFPRTMFQLSSAMASIGLLCLSMGVMGPQFIAVVWDAFGLTAVSLVVLWCWHFVEHEFAWPGWFVPIEAKAESGRFFVRREARRREKAEMIALGQKILRRERRLAQNGEGDVGDGRDDGISDGSTPGSDHPHGA